MRAFVPLSLFLASCTGFSVVPFRPSSSRQARQQHGTVEATTTTTVTTTTTTTVTTDPPSSTSLPSDDVELYNHLKWFEGNMTGQLPNPSSQLKSLAGDWFHQVEYLEFAQAFNRRFHYKPWFVVYCESETDVQNTFLAAKNNGLDIRVRAGGHDHEAECTGDNVIVIDVSHMNKIAVDHETNTAKIGVGSVFYNLTAALAEEDVMVAHGTCGSVCITGFTMGGGWGPWTRRYGMNCHRLVGAKLVLGDGSITEVKVEDGQVPELLWALRGGGGFSYGIATELTFRTFPLPEELIRFNIRWNPYKDTYDGEHIVEYSDEVYQVAPTLEVLKMWETSIESSDTPHLLGTNLMISSMYREESERIDYKTAYNNCIMYGYWEGNEEDLKSFVKKWYGEDGLLEINPHHGGTDALKYGGGNTLMSDWARIPTAPVLRSAAIRAISKGDERIIAKLTTEQKQLIEEGKPFPPDDDQPAPHKITCRLANKEGLQDDGYKGYIESLWSPNIMQGNRAMGLNQYTTLGAIVGDWYNSPQSSECQYDAAFPYADKLYTIQYQSWWSDNLNSAVYPDISHVNTRTNRALDWMEECRDYDIPNTSGSFISFKDSSIPTKTYFDKNYEKLIEIKKNYSKDPDNNFRSKKTII